jgi:hypothetical protein
LLLLLLQIFPLLAVFYEKFADKATEISDKILEEFKIIDKDLQKTTVAIDSANKILFDSLSDKKY